MPRAGGPIVLNRRAAARPTITGVERFTDEDTRRLLARAPGRYVAAQPRPALARRRAAAQAWEQLALPVHAARLRASLILSPANLAPVSWPGNVVVVHDAAVLRAPGAYGRAYRAWHRSLGGACARRARAVITVSEFSRRELVTLAGVDARRVTVIPGGVDERFGGVAADGAARAARALGLERPYVLTIATADARKNLRALEPLAAALRERGIDLVWAGDARPYFARTEPVAGVRSLGYVADELLPGLYRGARAFALPSLYEGFGLTCVEAMASGTPVVAADRAALPETCGDAALLVDPGDARALSEAVIAAATDDAVRARLRAAGRRRAAAFTWGRTAAAVDGLLAALNRSPVSPGSGHRPGTRPAPPGGRRRAAEG